MNSKHMKLQQLRCLTEVARRGLNVSEAAEALHTSQPGVSKQIRALEDELGVQVFVRHGKRLVSITEPGKAVVSIAERILAEAQNLRRAGEEFANDQAGTLTIAATHTQARYALPKAVAAFKRRYPKVKLVIHQGNPRRICASPPKPSPSIRSWSRCRSTSGIGASSCRRSTHSSRSRRSRWRSSPSTRSSRTTSRSRTARWSKRRSRC